MCSQHDEHARKENPPLQPIPLPDSPWERLMVDAIGPMAGPQAERYGLVMVDLHSRWPEVALCQDVTAGTVVHFLETVFAREGFPRELISDNGPAFRSRELREYLDRSGVRHIFSSPYSPQTCGMVERRNRTVKGAIQSARLAREPRSGYLRRFLGEYRATAHSATGESPFFLMRGREPRTALDVFGQPQVAEGDDRQRAMRERHRRYQAAYKERHDRTATSVPKWEAGDWVRVRLPVSGRLEGQPSVQVRERTGPVSYRVSSGGRVHARRLVPGRAGETGEGTDEGPGCAGDWAAPEVPVRVGQPTVAPEPPAGEVTVSPSPFTAPSPQVVLPGPSAAAPRPASPPADHTAPTAGAALSFAEPGSPPGLPRRSARKRNEPDKFTPSKYR